MAPTKLTDGKLEIQPSLQREMARLSPSNAVAKLSSAAH